MLDISTEDALAYIKCSVSPIRADILMMVFDRYHDQQPIRRGKTFDLIIMDEYHEPDEEGRKIVEKYCNGAKNSYAKENING